MNTKTAKTKEPIATESITTLKQWTELSNKTDTIELPSGAIVKVKMLNLLEEASAGHISLTLVNDTMDTAKNLSAAKLNNIKEEELKNMMELVNRMIVLAVVEPKVTESNVKSIPINDRVAIFEHLNKVPGGEVLKPFRKKR